MRSIAGLLSRASSAFFASALIATTHGGATVPSYTATDLGPYQPAIVYNGVEDIYDPGYTLSNTGADGTLTTKAGTTYAFPRTDNLVANPQSLMNTFPPFTNAPVSDSETHHDPNNAFSYFSKWNVFLNQAGEFVATDLVGVSGHEQGSQSILMEAARQAGGSFGRLKWIGDSPYNGYTLGPIAQALDLNNAGQVLGVDAGNASGSGDRDFFLYDIHKGVRTELTSLLPTNWYSAYALTIDDQGRILVEAQQGPYSPYRPAPPLELVLLTPAGLTSNPLPTPEPTTLVTLAVAGLGLAIRRRWRS